jgi:hypothetical protein
MLSGSPVGAWLSRYHPPVPPQRILWDQRGACAAVWLNDQGISRANNERDHRRGKNANSKHRAAVQCSPLPQLSAVSAANADAGAV